MNGFHGDYSYPPYTNFSRGRCLTYIDTEGADVNASYKNGPSALTEACSAGKLEAVKLLLDKGADINYAGGINYAGVPLGYNCLISAAINGHSEIVKFLLSKGVDINVQDKFEKNTALTNAAKRGHEDVVKVLLEFGADTKIKNDKGFTALDQANNERTIDILKKAGAKELSFEDMGKFDLALSIPYDKRLVNALRMAVQDFFGLLTQKPGSLNSIEVTTEHSGINQYQLKLKLNVEGKIEQYNLTLSSLSKDIKQNIRELEKIIQLISIKRDDLIKNNQNDQKKIDATLSQITDTISHFDYIEMFKTVQTVESKITTREIGPRLLFSAGEVFSWLAFFKNENQNRDLSDLLATHALSNYLLATLDNNRSADKSYYEGLLLLALDYPAAAEETFIDNNLREQTLKAFIKYDFNALNSFTKNNLSNKRLLSYLIGRAYTTSNQENMAWGKFKEIITDYPDFLIAKEYVVDNGSLGISRGLIDEYLQELLRRHLDLCNQLMRNNWVEMDHEFIKDVQKEVNNESRLLKWLKIHNIIVNHSNQLKQYGKILNRGFLNLFMMEDMANALMIHYKIESARLGRDKEAEKIVDMVRTAYPKSKIGDMLELKKLADQWYLEMDKQSYELSLNNENRFLNQIYLDQNRELRIDYNQGIYHLEKHRNLENPDAKGLTRFSEYYQKYFYRSVAIEYLKNALIANPYNSELYKKLLNYADNEQEGEQIIADGQARIGNNYGFLVGVAAWYGKRGDKEKAIAYYEKAINISPAQQSAYLELGRLYHYFQKDEKAVETWRKYLAFDDNTLNAVDIRNAIGETYLETGEFSKAYDVFLKAKDSWQARALLGFAKASEKTGKELQAEQYYKNAAERYPSGPCGAELAFFYLRQNNNKLAYETIKTYQKYNPDYYYFPNLTEHFSDIEKIEDAVTFANYIENTILEKNNDYLFIYYLANTYFEIKLYDIAEKILMDHGESYAIRTSPTIRWDVKTAVLYWKTAVRGNLAEKKTLINLIKRQVRDPNYLIVFGNELLEIGYYDEALIVFQGLINQYSVPRSASQSEVGSIIANMATANMATAWRLGSQRPEDKIEILNILKKHTKDQWLHTRVLFQLNEMDEQTLIQRADNLSRKGDVYYILGSILHKSGENNEALKYLTISLKYMSNNWGSSSHAYDLAEKLAKGEN